MGSATDVSCVISGLDTTDGWQGLRRELASATCAWADLEGLHVGPAPEQQPICTHLWAWSDDRAWRLRIDPNLIVGAQLVRAPAGTQSNGDQLVSLVIGQFSARPTPEPERAKALATLAAQTRMATTLEPNPITFLIPAGWVAKS